MSQVSVAATQMHCEWDIEANVKRAEKLIRQGHAAANIIPVIASNRIGTEKSSINEDQLTFYGSSFIANHYGELVEQANRTDEAVLVHSFDLDEIRYIRDRWGLFRDRRPSHYSPILTLDGGC